MKRSHDRGLFRLHRLSEFAFHNRCFLCGRRLAEDRTDEDVIPRWVQREFGLGRAHLKLLNGTSIPYSQLKIPCCGPCNNEYLSRLENMVYRAWSDGYEAFSRLDRASLHVWLSKILIGLLVRETMLAFDRAEPGSRAIVPAPELERKFVLHALLQSVRLKMKVGFQPWSIFIFPTRTCEIPQEAFDLTDDADRLVICIRLGHIGVVAQLLDNGLSQQGLQGIHALAEGKKLHPTQLREFYAQVVYHSVLLRRTLKYIVLEGSNQIEVVAMPEMGYSLEPLFAEPSAEDFVDVLEQCMSVPLGTFREALPRIPTWLAVDGQFFTVPDSRFN